MRRCRHKRSREFAALLLYTEDKANPVTRRWCFDCGSYLSLGHSDETDERVAIEIRAAEIAATLKATNAPSLSECEQHGWEAHANGMRPVLCENGDFNAGHLAREIVTHEETP
jgi:hypothetical protein